MVFFFLKKKHTFLYISKFKNVLELAINLPKQNSYTSSYSLNTCILITVLLFSANTPHSYANYAYNKMHFIYKENNITSHACVPTCTFLYQPIVRV